jgi:hypothetical protein
MNLAAILSFCSLSLALSSGSLTPAGLSLDRPPSSLSEFAAQDGAQPQNQAQSQGSTPTSPTPASPAQTKPSPQPPRHHKKAIPKCSNSPTALNPAANPPAESANSTGTSSIDAGSTSPAAASTSSANTGPASTGSAALSPCPPPKKVVRNGGSDEPTIQLTGGTTTEQGLHERSSTDQLTTATEANLKKAAGLRLNPSQQEMVSEIKQFMEQSRTAVAAGDLERGRNLAMKAHLLSDELVKP